MNEFGDWALDVPKMEMTVSSESSPWWRNNRCSSHSTPGDVYYFGTWYFNHEYWNGLKMHIPGQGAETVLDSPASPKQGNTKKATNQYWIISCFTISGSSEGFWATSPDGIRYRFDKLRYLAASGVEKNFKVMGRKRAQMLATRVEDRFGNWVNYNYSGNNLTSITSSDGRTITINYGANGKISTIVANGRTWTYGYTQYTGYNYDFLTSVTWPNGQSWSIDLHLMILAEPYPGLYLQCGATRTTATGTITHPYGAKGTYTITETAHGRTEVPQATNLQAPNCSEPYHAQRSFDVLSLKQKKLEGPGLPTMTWNYVYSENQGGWAGSGTNPLKTTRVNKPDGDYDIYHYDRSWSWKEGALVKKETFESAGTLLETVDYVYEQGPSRGIVGEIFHENLATQSRGRSQTEVVVTRGTDTFTTQSSFDQSTASPDFSFGRPIQVAQSNNFSSFTRTENIDYLHDLTYWELGRPTTVTVGSEVVSENVYDVNNRVWKEKRYGVEKAEYSYTATGTVAWQENALNQRTTLSSWKRGIPQSITYPDSTNHGFVVDNNGWITSSTDAKGYTTAYDYDAIGRMTLVEYPTNDGIGRLDKSITYNLVNSSDTSISGAGLVSGQWKQVKTRGDLVMTRYFDAMLRPVLNRGQDAGAGAGLDRFTRTSYDTNSQPTFTSLPSQSAAASSGSNAVYDALGRILQVQENVSPNATTSYQYLAGNKVRVTNPRGKQTTTTYYALGSPAQDLPTLIVQPESVTTTITRNAFGEMTQATQLGGGVSATRTYRYDSQHRLCRQIDPESSTAYSYNNADRLAWYALAASGGTGACNLGSVPTGERIVHTYNNVGQLTLLNYPDSSPDVTYGYDDNGNLDTLTSSSASWDYDYNAVNALREEKLITSGQTFVLNYGFDTQDRLTSITYPSGQSVAVTPNAYGEADAVSGYASNIDYHANGSIKSLTYANIGRVYSTTQNARQLPYDLKVMSGSSAVAHLRHFYDANANITSITDYVSSSANRSMTYDDLDRLETASGIWGSGSYSYDAIGNIRSKTEGGSTQNYTYDASNRLSYVSGSGLGSLGYDTRGNVTSFRGHGYTYNLAGNLVSSTNPGISYKYDGHKRRVQKIEGGQTSYSVYSRAGTLMHKKAGSVSTDYLYAGSMLLAEKTGSVVDYMHTDLLGSPIKGTNDSSYTEHYTPWGEKWLNPVQLSNDVGYTGHQSDIATGLTYMQARYYDPIVGRFMAVDPVGFRLSAPSSFGRYAYSSNSPLSRIDPDGRTDIYIGGKADNVSKIVQSYADTQRQIGGRTVGYFQHNQVAEAAEFAVSNSKDGEPLNIVGHSYGASAAVSVAQSVVEQGVSVDNLVGVDGVRKVFNSGELGSAAAKIGTVIGVDATGTGTRGDAIESLGRLFGNFTSRGAGPPSAFSESNADISISSDASHANFAKAYETKGSDGVSAKDIVDSSYEE